MSSEKVAGGGILAGSNSTDSASMMATCSRRFRLGLVPMIVVGLLCLFGIVWYYQWRQMSIYNVTELFGENEPKAVHNPSYNTYSELYADTQSAIGQSHLQLELDESEE